MRTLSVEQPHPQHLAVRRPRAGEGFGHHERWGPERAAEIYRELRERWGDADATFEPVLATFPK